MHRKKLSQVKPGMILAQPVLVDGVVLCNEGTELTVKVIERLTRREVPSVAVEMEESLSPAELGARYAEAKAAIEHRFRRLTADPFMMEIKDVFARQLIPPSEEESDDVPADDSTDRCIDGKCRQALRRRAGVRRNRYTQGMQE